MTIPIVTAQQYNALPDATLLLKRGDILIKKVFKPHGVVEKFINVQSRLRNTATQGTASAEHLALVKSAGAAGYPLLESVGHGTVQSDLFVDHSGEQFLVYRCREHDLRDLAVLIADAYVKRGMELGNWLFHFKKRHRIPGDYNFLGGMASPLRRKVAGPKNDAFLEKMWAYCVGESPQRPSFICSTFVATCFELAARCLVPVNQTYSQYQLGVDMQTMLPKVFEHIVNTRPQCFKRIGQISV